MFSMLLVITGSITAAPVRYNQITQIVNAKPGKANTGNYTQLRLSNDPVNDPVKDGDGDGDGDNDKSGTSKPQQDDRVITETSFEIIQEEDCDCTPIKVGGGFPYWALLGLGAIPFLFLIPRNSPTPTPTPPTTPTPTVTPTPTPTETPTPTPTMTPTPTPTETPTPTPTMTPTPTPPPMTPTPTPPEPIPEPITMLLFGTGLAGVGFAARRRFGKSEDDDETEE